MYSVCINKRRDPFVYAAATAQSAVSDLKFVVRDVVGAVDSFDVGIIALLTHHDMSTFGTTLADLSRAGCRSFVVLYQEGMMEWPWDKFPPCQRAVFEICVVKCGIRQDGGFESCIGRAVEAPNWATQRLREFAQAYLLHEELLKSFTHSTRRDLSNQFLAPARLMLYASQGPSELDYAYWRKIWGNEQPGGGFAGRVLAPLQREKQKYGTLGEELAHACRAVDNQLKEHALIPATIETLMSLLTSVRVLAGIRTQNERAVVTSEFPSQPVKQRTQSSAYRVLVVDDHAAAWTAVFDRLRAEMGIGAENLRLEIDYSLDGIRLADAAAGEGWISYSYYDLLVIDVFLGSRQTGIDLLERIRRDSSELPVLLWTTSRDEEIAAEASLANGILLKKTVSWAALKDSVSRWVVRGNAIRTTTLPNPFFNHAISKLEYRRAAITVHEWCLKQLDSFHALDDDFFRFFTDHGGRHIVKFWELLEQALHPFLQDDANLLLAANPDERQKEILCLYLAVICHELGMFPLRIGSVVEEYRPKQRGGELLTASDRNTPDQKTSDKKSYQSCVRELHAPRGMILLEQSCADILPQVSWNDSSGNRVGELLKSFRFADGQMVTQQVAVIVGYHARCFRDLTDATFLTWDKMADATKQRLEDACDRFLHRYDWIDGFQCSVNRLAPVFPHGTPSRDRLRRQCALFRFVDAIDISASRNPVEFLIEDNPVAVSSREYLKRELCGRIEIDRGNVQAEFYAPAPTIANVQCALGELRTYLPEKPKDQEKLRRAIIESEDFLKFDLARAAIEDPWMSTVAVNGEPSLTVLKLQKALDIWLEQVWRVLKADRQLSETFRDAMAGDQLIQRANDHFLLTEHGCAVVAALTALSVAGEVLDEYAAIVDAGIESRISLGKFTYKPDEWAKVQEHRGFRTLSRVTVPLQA